MIDAKSFEDIPHSFRDHLEEPLFYAEGSIVLNYSIEDRGNM